TTANITPAGALTGTVSSAVANYGIPTIAGAGQTIGYSQLSAVNGCIDADNDGIPDSTDLDDDNDGILDTAECGGVVTVYLESFESTTINAYDSAPNWQPGVCLNGQLIATGGANGTSKYLFNNTGACTFGVGDEVWGTKTALTVLPNTTYQVSYYMSAVASAPPQLETWINGIKVGNAVTGTTAWTKYTATWNSGSATTLDMSLRNLTSASSGNDFNLDEIRIENISCADTDGDGVVNSLDLDSDGDGCADAIEGGAAFNTANITSAGALTGTVSSATATNGVPTVAGAGQTIGFSQNASVNACLDSDNDGVADLDDLDDDNDGILDTVECPNLSTYSVYTYSRYDVSHASNIPFSIVGNTTTVGTFNQTTAASNITYNTVGWKLLATNVVSDASQKITVTIAPDAATTGSFLLADAMLITNGVNTYVIDESNTAGFSKTGAWTGQSFAGSYLNSNWVSSAPHTGKTATWEFSNIPNASSICDTDGDGISNHLDRDSDGDGCADAIEGGASFTLANLTPAGALTGTVSSATATYGIPTIAGAGQTIGFSQNEATNACTDTDGDGIADIDDLDDDNDGILDTDECNPNNLVANSSFTNGLTSWTATGGWASTGASALNNINGVANQTLSQSIAGLNSISPGGQVVLTFDVATYDVNTTSADLTISLGGTPYATISNRVSGAPIITLLNQATVSNFTTLATNYTFARDVQLTIPWVGKPDVAVLTFSFSADLDDFQVTNVRIKTLPVCDTDGDGIPNSLDKDSDGDGCPDAVEGAAAFTISGGQVNGTTGQLTGAVSTSAATYGVPVIAGAGQTIGISQLSAINGCTDTDGDAVPDLDDLDDDNDGILDTVECVPTNLAINGDFASGLTNWTAVGSWATNGSQALVFADNVNTSSLSQSITGLNTTNTAGNVVLTMDASAYNVSNSASYIGVLLGGTQYGLFKFEGAVLSFVPMNGATASNVTPVGASPSTFATLPAVRITIPWVGQPNTAILNFIASTTQSDMYVDNVSIQSNPVCDTDGDGIPNGLDKDSDGDGCPDAIEGGAAFNSTQVTLSGSLTGTVSSATATYGVPVIAGTGQTIGTSQNASVLDPSCPPPCSATLAPALSATTKSNLCPATTVDLSTITVSNKPASSTLTWHTGTPATAANRITAITSLSAGTYYAAFFDATANCYSGTAVTPVTAVTTACCSATLAPALSATTKTNVCPVTTVDLSTITVSNKPASSTLTWHTGTPATAANRITTITSLSAGTYYAAFFDATANCYSGTAVTPVTASTVACCQVGSAAPTLSATSKTNTCPATTIDLSTITASNTPAGTTLSWHSGTPATAANKLSSITSLAPGTYYAGFYDAAANCYSGTAVTPVTATTVACCQVGSIAPVLSTQTKTNTCPATTIDLSTITSSNTPAGIVLTWHTGNPATAANRITNITSVTAGIYYAAFYDATANCYSNLATTAVFTSTVACCQSGTVAPALSATSKTNTCPATTIDLSTITASNTPVGATLTWHTGTPATAANRITAITAVAPGTYYAAFFDATNNCFSGAGSAVTPVTASTVACCPNPSVGGSLTLVGTLPLCSVSNQGTLTLTGQTGTVVKWQTSTNGGLTFTDIPGTAGLMQYSFTNAQNNQQFRAVVNAGGSCSDANSTPFATPTSASACSVDCDVKPGGIIK
ncbi:beta strand repeat-containing protein, partial [Spirosoma aerophilum]